MKKEHLFSITLKDCEISYYKGSGSGGQKRNKTSSACQVKHIKSGAIGRCEDSRSQEQNRKLAFKRMSETIKFKNWINEEFLRITGEKRKIEQKIDNDLNCSKKTKIEFFDNGKWVDIKRKEFKRKPVQKNKNKIARQESKKISKDY